MKTSDLFNLLILIALTIGFNSCSDDDDPKAEGSFSDLIGSYTGKEAIYLVGMKRDTTKTDSKIVDFEKSSQNVNALVVNFHNNIGSDVIATNQGISNAAYSFSLSPINLIGDTQIPQYMKDWLAIDVDYSAISKIDLKLTAPGGGSLNRATSTMGIKYTGKVKFYYTQKTGGDASKEYDIAYEYKDLKK